MRISIVEMWLCGSMEHPLVGSTSAGSLWNVNHQHCRLEEFFVFIQAQVVDCWIVHEWKTISGRTKEMGICVNEHGSFGMLQLF